MEYFYLGVSEESFLTMPHTLPDGVRLCMSHRRLQRRLSIAPFPRSRHRLMVDSGMFGYCNFGKPIPSPPAYIAALRRYDREVGNIDWAAQQDLMCEPWMLAKTGRTVEQNQALNKTNYWQLHELWWRTAERDEERRLELEPGSFRFPDHIRLDLTNFLVKPTLQGWEPDDYRRDVEAWYAAGVNLHELDVVGLGSVCRRAATKPIRRLIEELAGFIDLHGFGLKVDALRAFGPIIGTADSMAWSEGTRHEVSRWHCGHGLVKWARNCPVCAIEWAEKVVAGAGTHTSWEDRWTGVPNYQSQFATV